jgi:hypothetical protein
MKSHSVLPTTILAILGILSKDCPAKAPIAFGYLA